MEKVNRAFSEKLRIEGLDLEKIGPFEKSDFQVGMALYYLKKVPVVAFAKAWLFGITKNLFAPAIIDFSYLLNLERPHFFYSKGAKFTERAKNFIRNLPGFFGWTVIVSIVILISARILQLFGFILIVRNKIWDAIFFFLIISYFLIVCGPVGYAKYRLPFEPILIIFLAIGIKEVYIKFLVIKDEKIGLNVARLKGY